MKIQMTSNKTGLEADFIAFGIRMLVLVLATTGAPHAQAFFGSPGEVDSSDWMNDNEDTVVKFGEYSKKKPSREAVARTLDPIEDNSYAADPAVASRAPASQPPAAVDRSPARTPPPKAIIRKLNERKAVQEIAVIINDQGFFPANLFVTQGIPVRLFVTGASKKNQCIMIDSFSVRRQIQSQKIEEIMFTPDETGTFAFNCPMNGARGNLLVKELEVGRVPANVRLETRNTEAIEQAE